MPGRKMKTARASIAIFLPAIFLLSVELFIAKTEETNCEPNEDPDVRRCFIARRSARCARQAICADEALRRPATPARHLPATDRDQHHGFSWRLHRRCQCDGRAIESRRLRR